MNALVPQGVRSRCACVLAAVMVITGCAERELRGRSQDSKDGRTYLIVADDNGGHCGPILVDGKAWSHALNVAGSIRPGVHRIACGTELEFAIDSGNTFRFDYWGP